MLSEHAQFRSLLVGMVFMGYVIHIEWCHEYLGYPFEGA